MVLAAAVSALAALVMALVAVFIACMAVDIVFAGAIPLVAAEVMRVDAVVTLAAADETFFAAGALVTMTRDGLRVPEPAPVLLPALTFGWLAALMDALLPVRRTRTISAEPRRVAE
jgi:hypothetical protein